jgi:intracellular proteinase inhibitor BsuPI
MSVWTLALLVTLGMATPAAAADPLTVRVYSDKATYDRNQQALITLEVKNTSSLPVTVSFSNGQKYEFTARDATGATVWNWSFGKTFSPSGSTQTLAAGQTWTVTEAWTFVDNAGTSLFDGTYTLTGTYLGSYLGRSGTKAASQDVVLQTSDPLVATFSTDKTSYSKLSSPAPLHLTITNVATYAVAINFQNGQQYEFTAKNSSGQVVWTWSTGKSFDPAASQIVLDPGASLQFNETWSFKNNSGATVADGNYTVGGTFLGQAYGAVGTKGGESVVRVYSLF